MAVETYPSFLQDESYSAEVLRHVFGTLLARGSAIGSIVGGLVGSTDMLVTAGSGMQVVVATGEAWIPGSSVSTQGGYLGRVTSSTALAISASSESLPRIDTIIAQVKDKAVAGGEDSFTISVVTGTATSGAKLPGAGALGVGTVPASSLVLAYVLVPAKAVSVEAADVENVAATFITAGLNLTNKYTFKSFTKAECEAGVEPSKSRPAVVNMRCETSGSSTLILVGGQSAGDAPATGGGTAMVWVSPAQKWITGQAMQVYTLLL